MASGLSYAHFPIVENNVALVIILSIVTVGYALICLYTSQEFQLKVAKLLTVIFALLMCFVAVGVAAQAGDDLYLRAHPTHNKPYFESTLWAERDNGNPRVPYYRWITRGCQLTLFGCSHWHILFSSHFASHRSRMLASWFMVLVVPSFWLSADDCVFNL